MTNPEFDFERFEERLGLQEHLFNTILCGLRINSDFFSSAGSQDFEQQDLTEVGMVAKTKAELKILASTLTKVGACLFPNSEELRNFQLGSISISGPPECTTNDSLIAIFTPGHTHLELAAGETKITFQADFQRTDHLSTADWMRLRDIMPPFKFPAGED